MSGGDRIPVALPHEAITVLMWIISVAADRGKVTAGTIGTG